MKRVIVLGGGVAGLTAAHELADRGFSVTLFERRTESAGGKARTEKFFASATDGRKPLPGEHGFRFVPSFYKHVPDTMRRIPVPGNANGVFDNLVPAPRGLSCQNYQQPFQVPMRLPQTWPDVAMALQLPEHLKQRGLTVGGFAFWMSRILQVLTTCEARRFVEIEQISWWDFVDAENRDRAYQLLLATGLTRTAVATQARVANARTIADIGIQLMMNMSAIGESADRVLTAPTTDAWIDPWVTHLKTLGVDIRMGARVESLSFDGRQVSGVRVNEDGVSRDLTADAYVCALPLNIVADLLPDNMIAFDPSLQGLQTLKSQMNWMTGIQFFLDHELDIVHGHINCLDSPWAVTALSQKQFWPSIDLSHYGDGTIRDIVSADISDWMTPATFGAVSGKAAWDCTKDEIAEQVWLQLQVSLNTPTPILTTYRSYWMDDAIVPATSGPRLQQNLDPLLVNRVNSWELRPDPAGHVQNFVLAGDYVRTSTDFASMESANEGARRAVNALLTRSGYAGPAGLCPVWDLHEPPIFAASKAIDADRFARGLPWVSPSGIPSAIATDVEDVAEAIAKPIIDIAHRAESFFKRIVDPAHNPDPMAAEAQQVAAIMARNANAANPYPDAKWASYQVWSSLFFAHWPLPVAMLRPLVPAGLEIDTFDGDAYVSIVAMEMTKCSIRGLGTVPGESSFPEINLRTYVKHGGKAGVFFIRCDADALFSDLAARLVFHLPYTPAAMSRSTQADGSTMFRSKRSLPPIPDATYVATFKPLGPASIPVPGSRTAFLRNRDYAFAQRPDGGLNLLTLVHDPWLVQHVDPASTRVLVNTLLTAAGLTLPSIPIAMDYTEQIDSVFWNPTPCN